MNEDNVSFNPTGTCQAGGIYFTDIDNLPRWLEYGMNLMKYCRSVTLPKDCGVYIEKEKFKADKIILGERVEISELDCWSDKDFCLNAVRKSICSLNYIHDINNDIQFEALIHGRYATGYRHLCGIQVSEEILSNFDLN